MKSSFGKAVLGGLALFAVCAALGLMFTGLVLMWTIGTAHDVWWPAIPEIGYWPAVRLGLPLGVLAGIVAGRSALSSKK